MTTIFTTEEAAEEIGTTANHVRTLVKQKRIKPIIRAMRPLTFWASDIYEYAQQRETKTVDTATVRRASLRYWSETVYL